MLQIRKSKDRGLGDHGWLHSQHTFSFADYQDDDHMGFRDLRVINEDRIAPATGFSTHGHRDMEIISYVIEGELEHKDSMGNSTVIRPDEVQRMSAGTGVRHSEHNGSKTQAAHFLQIWILPEKLGIPPGYGQKSFTEDLARKKLVLTVSREGRDGSISMNQDVDVYVGRCTKDDTLTQEVRPGRSAWLQMITGDLTVNGVHLRAGDGLAVTDERTLQIRALSGADFILFDLN